MIGESSVKVTCSLQILIKDGLVIKLNNGLFVHSIQMLQIVQVYVIYITKI